MTEEEELIQELFIQEYPQNADLAIVFGALIPEELKARVYRSVDLYHSGFVKTILMSGGYSIYPQPEAELMAEIALSFDVPQEAILLEKNSRNTLENATLSKNLLETEKIFSNLKNVILISSVWHMARVVYIMKKNFSNTLNYICCPETMTTPVSDWYNDKDKRQKVLNERILYRTLIGRF